MRLIAITDLALATADEHLAAYARLVARLPAGDVGVQVRMRGAEARDVLAVARLFSSLGVAVMVNDRLDVAKALGLGAHLGERSVLVADARALLGERTWISRALHDPAETVTDVDAVLLSPVFASPGKGTPLGLGVLAACAARARVPVFALGGVDGTNAAACLSSGAAGLAAIRACLDPSAQDALIEALRGVG